MAEEDTGLILCPECGSDSYNRQGIRNKNQKFRCKKCGAWFQVPIEDVELVLENIRLRKGWQRRDDSNRIERKSFREFARIDNAFSEYNNKLVDVLKEHKFSSSKQHEPIEGGAVGILQLSDLHGNELVNIKGNTYDFSVCSKRCRLLVSEAKQYFKLKNIKNVVFALTGDLLNSDRRLDELLSQATNRASATFLVVEIIRQMIIDLNIDFNINVICVTGNESRITDELAYTKWMATNNYDFTVFNILEFIFNDQDGIKFIRGDDPNEQVLELEGQNILFLHGTQIPTTGVEKAVQGIVGKYASKGTLIDFLVFGHCHSARVGDNFARSSSVVGANSY